MIYEGTIKYETVTNKGNTKFVRESYLIEDAETFSEAESVLFCFASKSSLEIDVVSL